MSPITAATARIEAERSGLPLRRAIADWAAAIAGFTLLSIVLTWPWAKHLWHGSVGGDAAQFVWDAWWVRDRVAGLDNPWWTNAIYAPEGTHLTAHPLEALLMVLVSPLTAAAGPMVTYGLLVIVTLAMAGVLACRLALAMGLGPVGSWTVGILWTSSPIVVHRTVSGLYMMLLLAALLPLALLLARRLLHSLSLRNAILVGAFLGACLLTDLQVTAYLVLATAGVLAYGVASRPEWRTRLALERVAIAAAVLAALGSPLLVMIASAEIEADYRTPLADRVSSATVYNADVAQLVLPSPVSRFFDDEYRGAAESLGNLSRASIDSAVTLGWATTILALIGVVATRRVSRTRWLAGAVVACAVLALGPNPKAFGHTYTPLAIDIGEKVSLLAPGTWILGVPVVNDLRIPARYMQLGALPLALLAGLGARTLVARRHVVGAAAVTALCALAVAEGAVVLRAAGPDDELAKLIRDDSRPGIVVDVPISWRSGIDLIGASDVSPRAMVEQTTHAKPIADGYIARLDPAMLSRLLARPLYRALLLRQRDGDIPSGLDLPRDEDVIADARRLAAHWIVVWPEADPGVRAYLVRVGYRLRAENEGTALYIR